MAEETKHKFKAGDIVILRYNSDAQVRLSNLHAATPFNSLEGNGWDWEPHNDFALGLYDGRAGNWDFEASFIPVETPVSPDTDRGWRTVSKKEAKNLRALFDDSIEVRVQVRIRSEVE